MTEENAPPSEPGGPPRGRNKRLTALSEEADRGTDFVENITRETNKVENENMGKTIQGLNEINLNQN